MLFHQILQDNRPISTPAGAGDGWLPWHATVKFLPRVSWPALMGDSPTSSEQEALES